MANIKWSSNSWNFIWDTISEARIGTARILLIRDSIRFDSPFNSDRFYEIYIRTLDIRFES